jgi:ribulose-phosphate 3-epimerase
MTNQDKAVIVPSLLSADMGRLAEAVALLENAGCDMLHVDIMDGHFVPNMTFGPAIVKALTDASKTTRFCVHLMVEKPEQILEKFVTDKVEYLTVHVETCPHLHRTLQQIRQLGPKPGIAINPGTSPEAAKYALPEAKLVLAMTVNPGFGGQKFIQSVVPKIETLARWKEERDDLDYVIEVDGGIGDDTIPTVVKAGARLLVAGNAVYGAPDPVKAYHKLSQLAEKSI